MNADVSVTLDNRPICQFVNARIYNSHVQITFLDPKAKQISLRMLGNTFV